MTVYVEYVLANNLIIDYLLLKATFRTTGKPANPKRLFFCAFLGAFFSLVYPLIGVEGIILTVIKITFGLLFVLVSARYENFRSYIRHATLFMLFTFLSGGIIVGVCSLLNVRAQNEITVSLIALPVSVIYKIMNKAVWKIKRDKTLKKYLFDVKITANGKTKECKAFLDTGNGVYDGQNPVIFCQKGFALDFFDESIPCLKRLKFNTVNGEGEKFAFCLEQIKVYNGANENIYHNVTACISEQGFEDGYQIILHPFLMEERYATKIEEFTKQVV